MHENNGSLRQAQGTELFPTINRDAHKKLHFLCGPFCFCLFYLSAAAINSINAKILANVPRYMKWPDLPTWRRPSEASGRRRRQSNGPFAAKQNKQNLAKAKAGYPAAACSACCAQLFFAATTLFLRLLHSVPHTMCGQNCFDVCLLSSEKLKKEQVLFCLCLLFPGPHYAVAL